MTSADDRDQMSQTPESGAPIGKPPFSAVVVDAAIQAEFETGRREASVEEAKRSIFKRLLRAVAGFTLIGIGAALIVLPGPGWVMIVIGLTMLPFAWAERTVKIIRKKIPGIPEEGRIPNSTWVVLGATMITFMTLSVLFGSDVSGWIRSIGHPSKLLG